MTAPVCTAYEGLGWNLNPQLPDHKTPTLPFLSDGGKEEK